MIAGWWWGSPEFEHAFGALAINDILSRICADLGIAADFTRPIPLTASPRPEYRSSVLLVTESDGASKQWSVDGWKELSDAIRARGLDVRMITRDEGAPELRVLAVPNARAPSPGDAAFAGAALGLSTLVFRHVFGFAGADNSMPLFAACIGAPRMRAYVRS